MQINSVQVGSYVYPLVEGQPLPIKIGETIRVSYSFKYTIPQAGSVRVWASLWDGFSRVEQSQTKASINLGQALEQRLYEGVIDIVVGGTGASTGICGLICELPGYKDAWQLIDNCINVTKAASIFESIIPLVVLGLVVGMMPMIMPEEEEGGS